MASSKLLEALEKQQKQLLELAETQHQLWKTSIQQTSAEIQALSIEVLQQSSLFQLKLEQRTAQPQAIDEIAETDNSISMTFEHQLTSRTFEGPGEPAELELDIPVKGASTASSPKVGPSPLLNSLGLALGDGDETEGGPSWRRRMYYMRHQRKLEYVVSVLVALHVCLLLFELEMEGRSSALLLDMPGEPRPWRHGFRALDVFFDMAFLLDLCVRAAFQGWIFCRSYMNCFEILLGSSSIADLIMIAAASGLAEPPDTAILHLIRAAASLRLIRFCKFFNGIHLLLKACTSFLPSLCWAMVLLTIFMVVGSLSIGNLIQEYIANPQLNKDDRIWLWERYGTSYRAMYTMYEITFAGNWPVNVRPVLTGASQAFVVFFVAYVTIIVFAVLRVITAVFLKDCLDAAQSDADHQLQLQLRNKTVYTQKLEQMFRAMDQSGVITEERLNSLLANPNVKAYFQTLDLDVHEGTALFHILDNGDGEVTLDEFIDGVLRCKGPARAIDQLAMHAELKQLETKIAKLTRMLGSVVAVPKNQKAAGSPVESYLRVFRLTTPSETTHN